jgi:hypothetical protein
VHGNFTLTPNSLDPKLVMWVAARRGQRNLDLRG